MPHRPRFALERLAWLAIPTIAIAVRLALGLSKLQEFPADPDQYLPLAKSVRAGEGLVFEGRPTAYRPPLYPLILAPLTGLFSEGRSLHACIIVLQAFLGGATTFLAMRAGAFVPNRRTLAANPEPGQEASLGGAIAGSLTAFDPVLVNQAPLVMTETLAAFLLTGAVGSLFRNRFATAGLWFGAAALCRPSLLVCMAMAVVARLITRGETRARRRMAESVQILATCGILLLPWGLRNWVQIGEPVVTTTHGGYTMALANNAVYYDEVVFGPAGSVWTGPRQQAWMDSIGTDTIGLTEPEADRRMKAKAIRFIREHPGQFVIACLHRQLRFWAVAPSGQVYSAPVRWACALWTIPFWCFVVLALGRRSTWAWPVVAVIAVVAGLAMVHLVYWTDIRMRAPVVPSLAILAGIGAMSAFPRRES